MYSVAPNTQDNKSSRLPGFVPGRFSKSYGHVREYSPDVASRVMLSVQGNCLRVKRVGCAPSGGGRRGEVIGFSNNSRKRMIEKNARISAVGCRYVLFATLTFPNAYPGAREAKRRFNKRFRMRLARRFGKRALEWKMEPQERGAPHFHLLMWLSKQEHSMRRRELYSEIRRMWAACIADFLSDEDKALLDNDCALTHCEWIRKGLRGVMSYCAKYMSKEVEQDVFRKVVCVPAAGGALADVCSGEGGPDARSAVLDNVTYMLAVDTKVGRLWGFWNAGSLPVGQLQEVETEFGQWFYQFRSVCASIWPDLEWRYGPCGWVIFVERPEEIALIAVNLIAGRGAVPVA